MARFTQEEAQRIFARVAERQRATPDADSHLTLEDLQEAARAAGLDPEMVAQEAAAEAAPSTPPQTLFGMPTSASRQRVLPGHLDDAGWAALVNAARQTFGTRGQTEQLGMLREWSVPAPGGKEGLRMTAEPTDRGTRVVISRQAREAVLGFSLAALSQAAVTAVFILLALVANPDFWIPALVMSAMAAVFGGGTLVGTRVWERRQAEQMADLLNQAEQIAGPLTEGVAPTEGIAPRADAALTPQIDLDTLPDASTDGSAVTSNRLRT